jgi:hypothetical protein
MKRASKMGINPAKPVYRDLGLMALFLLALVLLPTMASMDASAAGNSTTPASDVVAMAQWRLYLIIIAPSWFAAAIILVKTDYKLLVNRAVIAVKGILYL